MVASSKLYKDLDNYKLGQMGNLFRSRTLSCGDEGGARLEGDGAGPGSGHSAPLAGRSWLYSFLKPKE